MLKHLLSDDLPRSRWLSVSLCLVAIVLLLAPFLFTGARALNVAATISAFLVLVASFDLLLGYCGVVSFAHGMFYGIGAYGVAIALSRYGANWGALGVGIVGAIALSAVLSLLIALVSLRVKAIFFTMSTLAVAATFGAVVQRLSGLTGGDDGLNFRLPEALSPGLKVLPFPVLGVDITGKVIAYYLVVTISALLFLLMLRIVNSRFGRVLEAVRENEFRAEAIGYRTLHFRLIANCVAAVIATGSGILMAIWLRYVGPQTTVDFNVMLNILLMAVIGGLGTIYGAVIGVVVFVLAQNYIQIILGAANHALVEANVSWLAPLFLPDRWLLWFGTIFVLSVYFFPSGIVGKMREMAQSKRA
jgi:branched-chain amino acid transport system permease protein